MSVESMKQVQYIGQPPPDQQQQQQSPTIDRLNREKFEKELEEFGLEDRTDASDYGEIEEIQHQGDIGTQQEAEEDRSVADDYGEMEEIEHGAELVEEEEFIEEEQEEVPAEDEIIPEIMDMSDPSKYAPPSYAKEYAREDIYAREDHNSPQSSPSPPQDEHSAYEEQRRKYESYQEEQEVHQYERPVNGDSWNQEPLMGEVQVEQQSTLTYSISHLIQPGSVADLSAGVLELELSEETGAPLLLNVYNKWFGPCIEMSMEIEAAAFRLGTQMRVAKIDAEKFPAVAKHLEVGGLPTTLVLNGGHVYHTVEGCLQKEQILLMVDPYIKSTH